MIRLYNTDNLLFDTNKRADLIYGDMIYENADLYWIDKYWEFLEDGGVFVVQTDWHTLFEVGYHLKHHIGAHHINSVIWKCEFGNFPKNKFRQAHDDILFFSKGKDFKFYPERVQMDKVTAKSAGLNPSGRTTKLATSVWTDITLTTVSKERVKEKGGNKNIRWQKPLRLIERICSPFTDRWDLIIDPFLGSGTTAVWSKLNDRHCIGIELDKDVYDIAKSRLEEHGVSFG